MKVHSQSETMNNKLTVGLLAIHLILSLHTSVGENHSREHGSPRDLHYKIIGGQRAKINHFPHAVFLLIDEVRICGGSILRDRLVLTAAHCLYGIEPNSPVVAYIGHEDPERSPQVIKAKKWITHNKFEMTTIKYDVCMILLRNKIRLGSTASKILLIQKQPSSGMEGYAAGWGDTSLLRSGRSFKSIKQIVRKTSECRKLFSDIDPSQLCAGFNSNDNMAFTGDSGSALVVNGSIQVGVVSCGRPTDSGYTIYASIYYFRNWIRATARALLSKKQRSCF